MAHILQSPTTKGINVVFGGFLTWGYPKPARVSKELGIPSQNGESLPPMDPWGFLKWAILVY